MTFQPWIFNSARPGDQKNEDTSGEFFNTLDFSKKEEYIIRESFQNSGDAFLSDSVPVRVRIYVSGRERALSPLVAKGYFNSMLTHLEACHDITNDWKALFEAPCEFLVIEDFNTTGLLGDEAAGMHGTEANNFYHFFRTSGRTDKKAGTGKAGSWGVGKFVYIMSSKIRTMFGYTVRKHEDVDRQQLLLGQTALKFHTIDSHMFVNYGYFGIHNAPEKAVTMPYNKNPQIESFARDWQLERSKGQSGLSVVVPYCYEINPENLLFSIIKEYGGRILNDRLVVDLDFPGKEKVILNQENLFAIIDEHRDNPEWVDVQSLLLLLDMGNKARPSDWIDLPMVTTACDWKDHELPQTTKDALVARLNSDRKVFVRVPVKIQTESKDASKSNPESFFKVLIQQEDGSEPIAPVFYRDGLRISGKQMGIKNNGVRTVFISGDGIIAHMLTNAEGPAHTEWHPNRDKFIGKYQRGDVWLRFCKNAPRKIVEIARGSNEEHDYQALADIFPDPEIQATPTNKPTQKTRGAGGRSTGDVVVEQEGEVPVRINGIIGGFTLHLGDETKVRKIQVDMAYARVRGKTLSNWNSSDFTAGNLNVEIVGGHIISRSKNTIIVGVKNPKKFKLQVRGFDENRDLRVCTTEALRNNR